MADMSVETSRIRDVVRDSKIRSDNSSMLNQSSDSFLLGSFQGLAEQRHRRTRDVHRAGRGFPCVSANEVVRKVLRCNLREENKRLDFNSKFDEGKSWVHGWNRNEDPFNEFYNIYAKSESLIARFKRNLPVFDGFWNTEDLMIWIDAIDDFFEEINPPDHMKCKIVWYKMKGAAYYWWKQLQNDRFLRGEEKINSWPRMKDLLLNRFSHFECSSEIRNQLNNQEEGEEMVDDLMVDTLTPTKCSMKLPNNEKGEKISIDVHFDGCVSPKYEDNAPVIASMGQFGHEILLSEQRLHHQHMGRLVVRTKSVADASFEEQNSDSNIQTHTDGLPVSFDDSVASLKRVKLQPINLVNSSVLMFEKSDEDIMCASGKGVLKYSNEYHLESNITTLKCKASHPKDSFDENDYLSAASLISGGGSFGKDLKLFELMLNDLFYELKNDDWKKYGYTLPDRHLNLNLLEIVLGWRDLGLQTSEISQDLNWINIKMLGGIVYINFDPGGIWQNKLTIEGVQGRGILLIVINLYLGDVGIYKGKSSMKRNDMVTWKSIIWGCLFSLEEHKKGLEVHGPVLKIKDLVVWSALISTNSQNATLSDQAFAMEKFTQDQSLDSLLPFVTVDLLSSSDLASLKCWSTFKQCREPAHLSNMLFKMLLKASPTVDSLLSSENAILMRKILYDVVISFDYSFLRSVERWLLLHNNPLNNLSLIWSLVADDAMHFAGVISDHTQIVYCANTFDSSYIQNRLIGWTASLAEI